MTYFAETLKRTEMIKQLFFIGAAMILFSCNSNKGPAVKVVDGEQEISADYKAEVTIEKKNVKIEIPEGYTSIAQIMENRTSLSGSVVKVKGEVTKYNPSIMGKNWVHVQDGTEFEGLFDLTITTDEEFEVGQIVTITGIVTLDRDFGYGYVYPTLLQEGFTEK